MKRINNLSEFVEVFPLDYIKSNTTDKVNDRDIWTKTVQEWCYDRGYFVPLSIIKKIINQFAE